VEPAIEAETRSVVVRAVLDSPGALTPGLFAEVEVELPRTDALFVPSMAVMPHGARHRLYVVQEGKAALIDVELGQRSAERVQVVEGLASGAVVIVSNTLRLKPGIPVEVANRDEAAPPP
jgi:membrane fusion protein (multidrug efflux system)